MNAILPINTSNYLCLVIYGNGFDKWLRFTNHGTFVIVISPVCTKGHLKRKKLNLTISIFIFWSVFAVIVSSFIALLGVIIFKNLLPAGMSNFPLLEVWSSTWKSVFLWGITKTVSFQFWLTNTFSINLNTVDLNFFYKHGRVYRFGRKKAQ